MDIGAWWTIVYEVAESDTTKLTWNACILFVTLLEGTYVNFSHNIYAMTCFGIRYPNRIAHSFLQLKVHLGRGVAWI